MVIGIYLKTEIAKIIETNNTIHSFILVNNYIHNMLVTFIHSKSISNTIEQKKQTYYT